MFRTRHRFRPHALPAALALLGTLAGALLGGCGSNYQIDGHFVYSDQDENGNGVTIVITQAPANADQHAQHAQKLEVPLAAASEQARHALRQLQTREKSIHCTPKEAAAHTYTLEIHRHHQPAPQAAYYLSSNMACGQAQLRSLHLDGYIATEALATLFALLAPAPAGN